MSSYLIIIAGLGVSDVVLVRVRVPRLEAGCDGGKEKQESREPGEAGEHVGVRVT